MEEPGRLHYMGFLRVLHDFTFTFTFHFHALEKEKAIHVMFLPGESRGRGSLVSCCLSGGKESDTPEVSLQKQQKASVNIDAVNMGVHISL